MQRAATASSLRKVYKDATDSLVKWLRRAARKTGALQDETAGGTAPTKSADLLDYARQISEDQSITINSHVIDNLDTAIRLRKTVSALWLSLPWSDVDSNERHTHFIDVLERIKLLLLRQHVYPDLITTTTITTTTQSGSCQSAAPTGQPQLVQTVREEVPETAETKSPERGHSLAAYTDHDHRKHATALLEDPDEALFELLLVLYETQEIVSSIRRLWDGLVQSPQQETNQSQPKSLDDYLLAAKLAVARIADTHAALVADYPDLETASGIHYRLHLTITTELQENKKFSWRVRPASSAFLKWAPHHPGQIAKFVFAEEYLELVAGHAMIASTRRRKGDDFMSPFKLVEQWQAMAFLRKQERQAMCSDPFMKALFVTADTGEVTGWLPAALSIHLPVWLCAKTQTDEPMKRMLRRYAMLRQFHKNEIGLILSRAGIPMSESLQNDLRTYGMDQEGRDALTEALQLGQSLTVEYDSQWGLIQSTEDFLKLWPCAASWLDTEIQKRIYTAGISIGNARSNLYIMAYVYKTARHLALLNTEWPDMERVLRAHSNEFKCLPGDPRLSTSSTRLYPRFAMLLGRTGKDLLKSCNKQPRGTRHTKLLCRPGGGPQLVGLHVSYETVDLDLDFPYLFLVAECLAIMDKTLHVNSTSVSLKPGPGHACAKIGDMLVEADQCCTMDTAPPQLALFASYLESRISRKGSHLSEYAATMREDAILS